MRYILAAIIAAVSIAAGMLTGGYVAVSKNMPLVEQLRETKSTRGTRIYAADNTLLVELKVEKGTYVKFDTIPAPMTYAITAVEDARFWDHQGVDYISIARALVKDVIHRNPKQGGSTITQQLAKVTFLSSEKTLKRKFMEAVMAFKIERHLTKQEILEIYLNRVYFGHGAYGIEMASKSYFGKHSSMLNLAESAMLAGLVKAPTSYSPFTDFERAKQRQHTVLERMEKEGFITVKELQEAYQQPLQMASPVRTDEANGYFIEYIRKYLEDKYGEEDVYLNGYEVYTTLDRQMQADASQALQHGLRQVDKRRGWRGPTGHREIDAAKELSESVPAPSLANNPGVIYSGTVLKATGTEATVKTRLFTGKLALADAQWAMRTAEHKDTGTRKQPKQGLASILQPGDIISVAIKDNKKGVIRLALEQNPEIQGALVAMEPYTGYIRAMIGGYDYSQSDFNRAVYAKRQPGSSFKPIIYAAAMDNKFTPASIIVDEPVTYQGGPNGHWSPENYDHMFHGPTRLREALTYSSNVVTVRLLDKMGIAALAQFAESIGCASDIPRDLSVALGSFSVTPMEMALMYSVFAGQGTKPRPTPIMYVTNRSGNIVETQQDIAAPEQAISPQTAFLITSMMQDVVQRGTGRQAKALGRPVAAKTGTTNDYKDAWFVGYTPDLVTAVWVGMDNSQPLGPNETGSSAAAPIWTAFMAKALKGQPKPFTVPQGIVKANIDPRTGLLAVNESGMDEYFKEGTQPTTTAKGISTPPETKYTVPNE